ncbi:MAG: DUF4349 domain-containing protein [Butyrivibrio sp.]|nr:DUF4349 domain-containing protein [Butyrivibrio sp.]
MKKRLLEVSSVFLALALLCGCGNSGSSESVEKYATEGAYDSYEMGDSIAYEESAYEANDMEESKAQADVDENTQTENRKLITTMSINAETYDLNELMATVEAKVTELGGYIESSDINMKSNGYDYYRSTGTGYYVANTANLVIRIPDKKLDGFVDDFASKSNITYKSTSVEDVTLNYTDLETRVKALKTEEDRLLEFMEKAETIEDMMSVEDRLTDVQYELQSYESQLRALSNKVNYSTVNLSLSEVKEYSEVEEERDGFFDRIADGFVESTLSVWNGFKECIIWFVTHIPQLLVGAIFIAILVIVARKIFRKKS